MTTPIEWTVDAEDSGARLDVALVKNVPGMSRAKARAMTDEGLVRVNGRRARKGSTVSEGDVVRLEHAPLPTDFPALADPKLPLDVLYEDASVLVVNKPAGVPTHPLRPDEAGTLAGALVARYPELAGIGYAEREPGLVHRLDTDTSGVVLVARTEHAFESLRDALRARQIEKKYVALVEGRLAAPRTIELALRTSPRDPRKVEAVEPESDAKARDAHTLVTASEQLGGFSRVEVSAPVAGRHQIRAHLAHLGHPLAGDLLYGGPAVDGLTRHFLHARSVRFVHPESGKPIEVLAPLPAELEAVLAALR